MVEAHSILANKTIGGGCYIRPRIPEASRVSSCAAFALFGIPLILLAIAGAAVLRTSVRADGTAASP